MTPRTITLRHRNWIIAVEYPSDEPAAWTARREAAKAAVETQDREALRAAHATLIEVAEETASAFGGTLRRNIIGQWAWADGTPEPRVRDLHARECWPNYRCRETGDGTRVEVHERDLREGAPFARELAWCRAAADGTGLSGDHTGMAVLHGDGRATRAYADPATGETTGGKVIPSVLLVPIAEWDRRGYAVVGAQWDTAEEPAILAKAESLRPLPPV